MTDNHEPALVDVNEEAEGKCPVVHGRAAHPTQGGGNRGWWPNQLNLKILAKNPAVANPLGAEFDYAAAFSAVDLPALKAESAAVHSNVRPNVDEYQLKKGKRIYVLGQGRLVNLAAAEGHPPSVMDMSFATQALTTEYCVKNRGKLSASVHAVPVEVEQYVARHKLESMGIKIDELTDKQKHYMSAWEEGT